MASKPEALQPITTETQVVENKEDSLPTRLTQDEKLRIYQLRFSEGKSFADIEAITGRHHKTIEALVKKPEALAFRDAFHEAAVSGAVNKMKANAGVAADAWIDSLHKSIKGEKAQHLHAKEFLTHIKALEVAAPNTDRATNVFIKIGGREIEGGPVIEAEVVEDD